MYGVVVHANAVSMILNADYIEELTEIQQLLIAFVICFLNVALFFVINRKIPLWYDGLSLLLQLIQIIACTIIMIYVFKLANFKLNLTYTLAALALVGTCFELYENVVKRLFLSQKLRRLFTRKRKEVLTD
jgi:CHASE2 domain-containing sensor protein